MHKTKLRYIRFESISSGIRNHNNFLEVRLTTTLLIWFVLLMLLTTNTLHGQNSLKELATPKKIYIGNIISNAHLDDPENFRNGLADVHLTNEYNAVVLENYMKMDFVLPAEEPADIHNLSVEQLRAVLREDKIQAFLSNEDWVDLRKRGHAMIWFNQAPNWLNSAGPAWTGQQVFDFARKYIAALGQICGNRVDEWDVINEAISDDAPNGQRRWRPGTWYRRANDGSMTDWGEATYENFIKMLFVWAREAQPQARLHINDYAIEVFDTSMASKNRFMRDQVKALKDCGAPIDGVGFQSHLVLSVLVNASGEVNQGFIDAVEQSIVDLSEADIEVAITELDIRICNGDRDEAFQEAAFQAYCEMALSQPNCHEVLIWGLRDEDNWITLTDNFPFNGCQDAAIVEGDDYTPKAAYDGVAAAIEALPDQSTFGFSPLNQGNGAPADCGGMAGIEPSILSVSGPSAVTPGDQATVAVNYLASDEQDVVVSFVLNVPPFTAYSQVVTDVSAGPGMLNIDIDIPLEVPPTANVYAYQVFIAPDGGTLENSLYEFVQPGVTVLGEDSQLIISSVGPDQVSPGDTATVNVSYSAVEGQEIVVWFQLDQFPFTTFQEFRQTASTGLNEVAAKLFIPLDEPVATDAYQYQTILTPTGGGWPERISNIAQTNVDVIMVSGTSEINDQNLKPNVYPNPSIESFTVEIPPSADPTKLIVYSALGSILHQQTVPPNATTIPIQLAALPQGIHWLLMQQGDSRGVVKLLKY